MRNAFLDELFLLAKNDSRIVFMTGDLGFGVVEKFMEELPRQFVNAGVAEQNMTGVAAGMALSGKIVFTYSIANFPTLRCLEHIRNDVCYHNANVKVVSVGGGFAYGSMGTTHHATEDLGVMRMLPNMRVVAPGDPVEARAATRALVESPGPWYLRLGKAGEPVVHEAVVAFEAGRALLVREGDDVTLVSTGGMLKTAVDVADILAGDGVSARVLSMHTLEPLDESAILIAAQETGGIVTIEEHSLVGGLGTAVAEILVGLEQSRPRFRKLGVSPRFADRVGSQEYLRQQNGLDIDSIRTVVKEMLGR